MNKNTEQIKIEIHQTTERIEELTEQQNEASDILQNLQSGFIARAVSLDDLQNQQSRLTVLTASVDALESRRAQLEADLRDAEAVEKRAELVSELVSAAKAAANSFSEHARIADELNAHLERKSGELLDHTSGVIENRQKFRQLYFSTVPRDNGQNLVPGADIYLAPEVLQELKSAGALEEEIRVATAGALEESDGEFSGVIRMAKELQARKKFLFEGQHGLLPDR